MPDHSRQWRTTRCFALALMLPWLAATGCRTILHHPMPPDQDVVIGPEQRIGAMMSVRGHVLLTDRQLRQVTLMPLDVAVRVLDRDVGARAASRRRRATALLLAARTAKEAPIVGQRLKQVRDALGTLKMNAQRLDQLDAAFYARYPALRLDPKYHNVAWLDFIYTNMIEDLFPDLYRVAAATCSWRKENPGPSVTPIGQWPVVLSTKVSVNIPVNDVALHIDPQQWDQCSEFWNPPPNATRLMDWVGGQAIPKGNPPAVGSAYRTLTLMQEKFKCGSQCGDADFDLLLCVTTQCDPAGGDGQCATKDWYMSAYNLPLGPAGACLCPAGQQCPVPCGKTNTHWWLIKGKIGSNDVTPCIDEGSVEARKDPNYPSRTLVEAEKTLHFDPSYYSTGVAIAWNLYLQEMNDELGSLACCAKNP